MDPLMIFPSTDGEVFLSQSFTERISLNVLFDQYADNDACSKHHFLFFELKYQPVLSQASRSFYPSLRMRHPQVLSSCGLASSLNMHFLCFC